eukprot:11191972-Lingulodinium_polyedra.AAC.1
MQLSLPFGIDSILRGARASSAVGLLDAQRFIIGLFSRQKWAGSEGAGSRNLCNLSWRTNPNCGRAQ